ncbi:MAG: hypothetical protein R3B47_08835 [Bacteroidia bacterium]
MNGKLEKIRFQAYHNSAPPDEAPVYELSEEIFTAQLNPNSLNIQYAIEYDGEETQPIASEGTEPRYQRSMPTKLDFELMFDGTGVVPKPPEGILGALENVPMRAHSERPCRR